jgi:hypothetical protein
MKKKETYPPVFSIRDAVKWTSSSNGTRTTKHGTIVAIVAAGVMPYGLPVTKNWHGPERLGYGELTRVHESYLVAVGATEGCPGTLYWPRVGLLRRVGEAR